MSEMRADTEYDPKLSLLYRAAGNEEPSPELDEAILKAAREVKSARGRAPWWLSMNSWQASLAVAAVIVLSVSLVTVMRSQLPEPTLAPVPPGAAQPAQSSSSLARAPEKAASSSVGLKPPRPATNPRLDNLASNSPRAQGATQFADKNDSSKLEAQPPSPSLTEASSGQAADKSVGAFKRRESEPKNELSQEAAGNPSPQVKADAAPAAPAAKNAAPARALLNDGLKVEPQAALVTDQEKADPDKWVNRILQLREQGKTKEAYDNLVEFRGRYPGYRLPSSLANWENK